MMGRYAMWHVPHHLPFLEVFEKGCAAGAEGAGGTGGAGGNGGAGGAGGAGGNCVDFVIRHGERHVGVLYVKKKEVEVKKGSEGEGTIRGHQMWRMGCVATKWWIKKDR